jgi:hypothetical protein
MLAERGAHSIEHPGGTLYAHLVRVHQRLAGHGLAAEVQQAGLAHAAYGTDGFDVVLFDHRDREPLRALVGPRTELMIYRYGGCDRSRTWSELARTKQVWSRFDGTAELLDAADLRAFVDLSIVNELDVVEQSAEIAGRYGEYFRALFADWRLLASPQVSAEAQAVLAHY